MITFVNIFMKNKKFKFFCLLLLIFSLVISTPVFSQIKPSARDLVEEGKQYRDAENYHDAIEKLQEAIAIFEEKGERKNLAITLSNLSRLYLASSHLKEAIQSLEKAVLIFEKEGNSQQYLKNLTVLGKLQLSMGEADKALSNFKTITNIYQKNNDKVGFSNSLINQGKAMTELGLISRACPVFLEALTFELNDNTRNVSQRLCQPDNNITADELNKLVLSINNQWYSQEDSQYLDGLRNLGKILTQIGNINQSEIVLRKTLEIIDTKRSEIITHQELSNDLTEEKVASLISLGNTLSTKATLDLAQYDTIEYDYQPWQRRLLNIKDENKNCRVERICQSYDDALKQYEKAISLINNSTSAKIKAQINYLSLLIATEETEKAMEIAKEIDNEINLPINITESLIFAKIKYAKNLEFLQAQLTKQVKAERKINSSSSQRIEDILKKAIEEAKYLDNKRAESYALGNLAGFYEQKSKSKEAIKLTQQALYLAQPSETPDLAYQWQWQLARLLTTEGQKEDALYHYAEGLKTLEKVKKELLNVNIDVEFAFRKNITPFYYQYLDLLLEENATDVNLKDATTVVSSLQKAELENYLRCNLDELNLKLPSSFVRIDEIGASPAAIVYPILHENSLDIVVKIPSKTAEGASQYQIYRETSVNFVNDKQSSDESSPKFSDFLKTVNTLNTFLSTKDSFPDVSIKSVSQQLYDWLILPVEKYLPEKGTLVFVLDINSGLQNIPISVLYDGERYLSEKYSISVSLSPQIKNPQALKLEEANVLLAGISKQIPYNTNLEPLRNVKKELQNSAKILSSQILENDEFTEKQFQNHLKNNNYSIIHLASHGQFSSNPNNTVIYAWDKTIDINTFGNLVQQKTESSLSPINLLVFSACETAKGDDKAPLGIGGMALRSGASSILASLWQVDDAKTAEFMTLFYENLKKDLTLAEALRQAQLSFIKDSRKTHPYYWSPFILAGNWF